MKFDKAKVEDCFNGSRIYDIKIDRPININLILKLGALGRLEYFKEFPRPFFRIHSPEEGFQIKGVEGEHSFRIILSSSGKERGIKILEETLDRFVIE